MDITSKSDKSRGRKTKIGSRKKRQKDENQRLRLETSQNTKLNEENRNLTGENSRLTDNLTACKEKKDPQSKMSAGLIAFIGAACFVGGLVICAVLMKYKQHT